MTKTEFFRHCDTSKMRPTIRWGTSHHYMAVERSVFLTGLWGAGSITETAIYTPTPGRQGDDCYLAANAACEKAAAKFEKWLAEWEADHQEILAMHERAERMMLND